MTTPSPEDSPISNLSAVSNRLFERRSKMGITRADLAARAGLTRQAVYAIEANRYLPSTQLALRLARILECRVEDLFCLADEEHTIEADVVGVTGPLVQPVRVKVARIGTRLVARPMSGLGDLLTFSVPADGVIVEQPRGRGNRPPRKVQISLLHSSDALAKGIFIAGCDPALLLAGEHVRKINALAGVTNWTMGSTQALHALQRDEVHMAGLHLVDGRSGESNLPYLKRHAGGHEFVGVRFASWVQGILVKAGNPKHIRGVHDFGQPGFRLVNREAGSGARLLLDTMLKKAGLSGARICGYEYEVASHLEVARLIRDGMVDAGIGLETAARHFGLAFVPLREEHYDLIMRVECLQSHPVVSQFLDAVVSRPFRREIEALGGYNLSEIGKILHW